MNNCIIRVKNNRIKICDKKCFNDKICFQINNLTTQ